MLHSVFGSNRPPVQVFLLLPVALGVIAAGFFAPPTVNALSGPPLAWLQTLWLDTPFRGYVLGGVLVLVSAYLINHLYNTYGFAGRENYFPGLVYVLFSLGNLGWLYIHPALWANLFVLLAARRLLAMYRVRSALGMVFDAGLLLGLAVVFYPPSLVLVPLIWLALMRFRAFDLREWLTPFTGLATVALYAFSVYFLMGRIPDLSPYFAFGAPEIAEMFGEGGVFFYLYVIITVLVALAGVGAFVLRMQTSTVHLKNTKAVFLRLTLLEFGCLLYALFLAATSTGAVMVLAAPLSVFAAMFFVRGSNKGRARWVLLLFYLWLLLSVVYITTANL